MIKEATTHSYIPIKIIYWGLLLGIAYATCFTISLLFIPLLIALILSLLLKPLVIFLEKQGLPRLAAVSIIFLTLIGIIVGASVVVMPMIADEVQELTQNLPRYESLIRTAFGHFQIKISKALPFIQFPDVYALMREKAVSQSGTVAALMINSLSGLFSILSAAIIIPLTTFFFLKDAYGLQKVLLRIVPNRYFEMMVLVLHRVMGSLQSFIRGQLIDATVVGVLTSLGLLIMGFPYALVIGAIAGVGNLIPYFGLVMSFIPALVIMAATPGWFGVWPFAKVLGLYFGVHMIDNIFVYPLAVGRNVKLHPILVFLGIVVGGKVAGVLGMIVAIPLIAIVKVTFEVVHSYLRSYSII